MKCEIQLCIEWYNKQLSAKLISSSGVSYLTLNAFSSTVTDIAQQEEVTVEGLLSAPSFILTYENNVITSIH